MGYVNTAGVIGQELKRRRQKAYLQEKDILHYMQTCKKGVTAWDIQERFPDTPITSIRRSLFYLHDLGEITFLCRIPAGPYRHKCSVYKG